MVTSRAEKFEYIKNDFPNLALLNRGHYDQDTKDYN